MTSREAVHSPSSVTVTASFRAIALCPGPSRVAGAVGLAGTCKRSDQCRAFQLSGEAVNMRRVPNGARIGLCQLLFQALVSAFQFLLLHSVALFVVPRR